MQNDKIAIKQQILQNLEDYGIQWDEAQNKIIAEDFREIQRKLAERTNPQGQDYKSKVQQHLAQPADINISQINPYLVTVDSSEKHHRLWAYATSHWSVPVTTGYGRRIRYFVFDQQNEKLIGIVGLCDPVIGLGIRDINSIGWTKDQKMQRLYNCMTAYILGAIPPYNQILGSKLVALTLMFPEIKETFYQKYKDSVSIIKGEKKNPYLVYIDTLGAFGKSAIYTKLINWKFVGYTKGESHLHITANGSWELIKQVVPAEVFNTYKYGQGPNWKMRILKSGLRELGLSENMLGIGWQRGYYRCTLAENWKEYLLGETDQIQWQEFVKDDLVEYWHNKWITPRLEKLKASLRSDSYP